VNKEALAQWGLLPQIKKILAIILKNEIPRISYKKKSVTAETTMTKEQGMLLCDILVSFR
jgi:hypothetical protein